MDSARPAADIKSVSSVRPNPRDWVYRWWLSTMTGWEYPGRFNGRRLVNSVVEFPIAWPCDEPAYEAGRRSGTS